MGELEFYVNDRNEFRIPFWTLMATVANEVKFKVPAFDYWKTVVSVSPERLIEALDGEILPFTMKCVDREYCWFEYIIKLSDVVEAFVAP